MIFSKKSPVGIVSYGAQIPKLCITGETIARPQGKSEQKLYASLGVASKTIPRIDEDTITLATEAGFQALQRLEVICAAPKKVRGHVGALFIGSESHPYAVKPSGTVVAQALGIASDQVADDSQIKPLALADLQFACKAGTQSFQIAALYVLAGFSTFAMAIGADTAQAKPGDILEYTAGAGAACFVLGKKTKGKQNLLAELLATTSVATDTPDFWRRPTQTFPEHAGRFTSGPGYFFHITLAAQLIMKETGLKPSDFEYVVFHTPNAKFPTQVAKQLGFSDQQIEASLLVKQIGNTYAAASLLGLVNTLDIAKPNKKILVVSYGSGAGSDAFVFETTNFLESARKKWQDRTPAAATVAHQIKQLQEISYSQYRKNTE